MTARTPTRKPKAKKVRKPKSALPNAGLTVGQLTRSLQHRRHRVAILEALGEQAVSMFTTSHGGEEPDWAIGDGEGSVERALEDVVFEVVAELQSLAEKDRSTIQKLINQDVAQLTPTSCPIPESEDDDDDDTAERVLDQAILNIPPMRQKPV